MTIDSDSWCTPERIAKLVHKFADGPVWLDPCSNERSLIQATIAWYGPPRGRDGLVAPWCVDSPSHRAPKTIYVNPPYSDKPSWMAKCLSEHRAHRAEILSLIPADTDTEWWRRYVVPATLRCFVFGRLQFLGTGEATETSARFPSVVVYYGKRRSRFRQVFKTQGWIV